MLLRFYRSPVYINNITETLKNIEEYPHRQQDIEYRRVNVNSEETKERP